MPEQSNPLTPAQLIPAPAAHPAPPPPRIDVVSVDELLATKFPASDSLLGNGLIDKFGAILISGPQKIGKSLFGTQLALSLAAQRSFIGFPTGPTQYKTLILQAEVSPKRMKERFEKQIIGYPNDARKQVLTASVFSSIKLDSKEGIDQIYRWLTQFTPDLLIVDPLSNFHTGDENVAKDMIRITGALDGFRKQGVAVALVHHHGKASTERANVGQKARGSSALPGWYDSHFSLEWASVEARTVRLKFELRHDETPSPLLLQLNPATLHFQPHTDEESPMWSVVRVVEQLARATREAVAAVCNKTPQWAGKHLANAAEQGLLVVDVSSRPMVYSRASVEAPSP